MGNLPTQTRIIEGLEIHVSQLPARRALRLRNYLLRTLAPGLEEMGDLTGEEEATSALVSALGRLIRELTDEQYDHICAELFSSACVKVNNVLLPMKDESTVDSIFTGKIFAYDKAMIFALEVNYKDFFSEIASKLRDLFAKAAQLSQSFSPENSKSSGRSGDSGLKAS